MLGERGVLSAVSTLPSTSLGCVSTSLTNSLPVSLVTTNTGTGGTCSVDTSLSDNLYNTPVDQCVMLYNMKIYTVFVSMYEHTDETRETVVAKQDFIYSTTVQQVYNTSLRSIFE